MAESSNITLISLNKNPLTPMTNRPLINKEAIYFKGSIRVLNALGNDGIKVLTGVFDKIDGIMRKENVEICC